MAQLSVSAAARAVGKDRGTIHRYIKSGKLSTTRDAAGNTVVETSELLRVFGALKGDGGKAAVAPPVAPVVENNSMQQVLEVTLELLKGQLKASQDREERLLDMLQQEQQARWSLEQRLLPPGTETAAPDQKPADPENGPDAVNMSQGRAAETGHAETIIIQAEATPVQAATDRDGANSAAAGQPSPPQGATGQGVAVPAQGVSVQARPEPEKKGLFARLFGG